MASLYPSLEDMKVDQIQKAQVQAAHNYGQQMEQRRLSEQHSWGATPGASAYPSMASGVSDDKVAANDALATVYPSLMDDYMGLKLEPPSGPIASPPPYPAANNAVAVPHSNTVATPGATAGHTGSSGMMIAPLSGSDVGLRRAQVTHGVREVIACKDETGKLGVRLRAVNKGIFVQCVTTGSPAALAGIRFGDQILQINAENVAGYSDEKAMELIKKSNPQRIILAIRDRPFERTITLHKDSVGYVGFQFKNGKINAIGKESSAARNGLLTEHQLLEVGGQNVVGMKDADITTIIDNAGQTVTITVMPSYLYNHMIKHMASGLVKKLMDHSIPDV